jgi:predicted permease
MRLANWLYTIPLRAKSLFRRTRLEQELDEEFQFHLEQRIEAAVQQGLTPAEARAEAIRALDNMALRKEQCRDARGLRLIEDFAQDLRYAARTLRKSPAFAAVAVLSLALGIGANTAIFSVMDVLLLRPLPVPNAGRLELVSLSGKDRPRYSFTYTLFELIRDRNQVFAQTFAWSTIQLQTPVGSDMVHVPATFASGDYFAGLGTQPILGRVFGREEDRSAGASPVAVISDGFWSRRYGRNPAVAGQSIVLNGIAVTIIGVMPQGFFGAEVGNAPDVWVPLNLQRRLEDPRCISSPSCWYLRVMADPKPGVSEPQARAQLQIISRGIMEDAHPPARPDRRTAFLSQVVQAEPGATGWTGLRSQVRGPLRVLMALVAFVLLIACANMANLLTARAAARHKEVAIRLAMGAARWRVIRQLLTESLLLAGAGAVLGFLIAIWATRVLIAMVSSTAVLDLRPDWRVLMFTALAALGTGLLFGLAPAFRATRAGIGVALRERGHQIQGGEGRFGFTRLLLGAQVALSIVLLAAAGLLAGSLVRLITQNPGFDPRGVTVLSLDTKKLPQKGPALLDLYDTILHRTREMPGVESASTGYTMLTNSGWDNFVTIPGRPDIPEDQRDACINPVSSDYLRTMRIPLLAGRDFTDADSERSQKVALLSENAARRWFPRGALGAELIFRNNNTDYNIRIVGITRDVKYFNLREEFPNVMFLAYNQWDQHSGIAIRTAEPISRTYSKFRDVLRQVAPGTPIGTVKTMEDVIDELTGTERLTAYLSLFFAGLALLLTAVGLYGILAYAVARRTSEIGVRMALGAQRGTVIWLVMRDAMANLAVGAALGLAVVIACSKLIASLLYGVRPNDPGMMLTAITALAAVCAFAAWIPARRASRLDPMTALRED